MMTAVVYPLVFCSSAVLYNQRTFMLEQMIKLYSWYMGAGNVVFSGVCCGPAPALVGAILCNVQVIKGRILNIDNC